MLRRSSVHEAGNGKRVRMPARLRTRCARIESARYGRILL